MATEAAVKPTGAPTGVGQGMTHVLNDVYTLFELQSRIFLLDVKRSARQAYAAFGVMVLAGMFLFGAIPVGLAAIGLALASAWAFTLPGAFLVVVLGAFAVGGGLMGLAYLLLRSIGKLFQRSRAEFERNRESLRLILQNE